eukprot:1150547-Pelagomonas_calceolata.AAC.1
MQLQSTRVVTIWYYTEWSIHLIEIKYCEDTRAGAQLECHARSASVTNDCSWESISMQPSSNNGLQPNN